MYGIAVDAMLFHCEPVRLLTWLLVIRASVAVPRPPRAVVLMLEMSLVEIACRLLVVCFLCCWLVSEPTAAVLRPATAVVETEPRRPAPSRAAMTPVPPSWAEVSWPICVVLRPLLPLVEAAVICAALRFCTCAVVRLDSVVPPPATRLAIAEVERLEMALVEIACRSLVDRSPNCWLVSAPTAAVLRPATAAVETEPRRPAPSWAAMTPVPASWAEVSWPICVVLRPLLPLVEAAVICAALRFCTMSLVRLDSVVPPAATRFPIAEVERLEMALVEIACRSLVDSSGICWLVRAPTAAVLRPATAAVETEPRRPAPSRAAMTPVPPSWAEVSWPICVVLRPLLPLVEAAVICAALRFCTCAVVRLDSVVPPAATRFPIAEVERLEMALVEIACRSLVDRSPSCWLVSAPTAAVLRPATAAVETEPRRPAPSRAAITPVPASWAEVNWPICVVLRPLLPLVEAAVICAALRFCTCAVVRLDSVVPPAATRFPIAEVERLEMALVEIA